MTDDIRKDSTCDKTASISKVVAEMRSVCPNEERFGTTLHGWADRLESATLARQISASEASLAEAKERMRELEAQRDDYLNREWVAEKAKRKAESQLAEAVSLLEKALDQMKSNEISIDCEWKDRGLHWSSPLEDWSPMIQQIVKYLQENKNE